MKTKTLLIRTLDQWRDWLSEHHASEPEVWLIFHKHARARFPSRTHSGGIPIPRARAGRDSRRRGARKDSRTSSGFTHQQSIGYKDALDEALCFGWVDSLIKRLNDRRYARKFTPRRADSRWSAVNRKRYAELKSDGRLKPPGIERPPTARNYPRSLRPPRLELPSKLPAYIQAELKKHPKALRHYEALAPEQRRRYFAWIESAKREETKLRRLKEAIHLLAGGKVLGLK